ncbi:hypothetical protein QTH91_03065 [Variovorax dokdonensis]|uniref:Uncharacterized protein n=1 Tax=Variovorax dokdonensis TaxID=344883 RepID=A0ABT7N6C9_9BURK|nr:hypothetical protein [Variovorax dokdonensis]MDM0043450.1 hypothetical protein [Variovorax dokdonensis]
MRQMLSHLFPSKDENGARLAAYAFLVAILGAVLGFGGFPKAGYWIVATAILLGLGGIVAHFVVNWRSIFHIDQ